MGSKRILAKNRPGHRRRARHRKGTRAVPRERGYRVAVCDLAARDAGQRRWQAHSFIRCDVSREASVRACVRAVLRRFGRLDALVNNAGIADPAEPPVEKLAAARSGTAHRHQPHQRVPDDQALLRRICGKRAARSSTSRRHGRCSRSRIPRPTPPPRAAWWRSPTRSRSASARGARELREPGMDRHRQVEAATRRTTRSIRSAASAGPRMSAQLVAFLLSDAAGFATGQNYIVDGGMTRKMIYVE